MQEFEFEHTYDALVTCWGLGYLDNLDCKLFLLKCKAALRKVEITKSRYKTGMMFVRENTHPTDYKNLK